MKRKTNRNLHSKNNLFSAFQPSGRLGDERKPSIDFFFKI